MPKIKVHRSSQYSNKFRNIGLYLDGTKLGEIADGKTVDFEIINGEHILVAKIDWASSNEVKFVVRDQDVEFKLSGTSPMLALYYITFGRKSYLNLEKI
jgi:hypothetical protein